MINLALIGNGKWGKNYLKEIEKISDVQIKYIRTYDYQDLITKNDIDGIIIATPDKTHLEILTKFPQHYILVEKPVVSSLIEALEIKNPKIMAGHIYLYNMALLKIFKDLPSIQSVNFTIKNMKKVENTTPLWHLAIHGIALFIYLWGEPDDILAEKRNDNLIIDLLYRLDKQKPSLVCRIEVGWGYTKKERTIKIEGIRNVVFDCAQKQEISPLGNMCRNFVHFIQGGNNISGLDHIKVVTSVLEKIDVLIR